MTLFERRLRAEWELLQNLAATNPGRIVSLHADDTTFHLTLRGTPALPIVASSNHVPDAVLLEHEVRIEFPEHFPAMPMMLYLKHPAMHPNIHPENGFVCLWSQHRVSNTVEHALHKTVAILGFKLFNDAALHVMQPTAMTLLRERQGEMIDALQCAPLVGINYSSSIVLSDSASMRRRLS